MGCLLCPRECRADRENGQVGYCGVSDEIRVARAALHMWEEPCISGDKGSGTIFFVGCPLGCIYCQNYEISRGISSKEPCKKGKVYTVDELSKEMLRLQSIGAHNINLVTPTHYTNKIISAIQLAKEKGLRIPIVYNCGGYEKVDTLRMLEGIVDIYLTDFKYSDDKLAMEYSNAPNYCSVTQKALDEMVRQIPECVFEGGLMKKGVIVRNLLLPGHVKNSKDIASYVYNKYKNAVYISIMNQYTPLENVSDIEPLNRKVTKREYRRLIDFVLSLGADNVYIQEEDVAKESFIPDFE